METYGTRLNVMGAPLQGFTDVAWRHFHRKVYGEGVEMYYTPFLRVKRGEVRPSDLRALRSELNVGVPVTPQVIFNSVGEFTQLVDAIVDINMGESNAGSEYRRIDMNMGCPFPPQVHHGRGSALLRKRELLEEIADLVNGRYSHIGFSAKMRLGVERADEWRDVIAVINAMNLTHVTVHPRVASQQYRGELYFDEFLRLCDDCRHPVVFNGDVTSVEGIQAVKQDFPSVKTVMIGRGLLMRPSLAAEYSDEEEWSREKRMEHLLRFHRHLYDYYSTSLSGEAHLLQKLKPFWEYLEDEIGRKAFKQIKKSTTVAKYMAAVTAV